MQPYLDWAGNLFYLRVLNKDGVSRAARGGFGILRGSWVSLDVWNVIILLGSSLERNLPSVVLIGFSTGGAG